MSDAVLINDDKGRSGDTTPSKEKGWNNDATNPINFFIGDYGGVLEPKELARAKRIQKLKKRSSRSNTKKTRLCKKATYPP